MAIRTVVTAGFGNGTFNGTIADVVTRGYTIGVVVVGDAVYCDYYAFMSDVDKVVTVSMSGDSVVVGEMLDELARYSFMSDSDKVITVTMGGDVVVVANIEC